MSRRQRVPRHKGNRRKRNKNPKLSPFQREQQRAKLANQAPIASIKGNQRDYPVSQRAVMEYLIARRQREQEKRQRREEAAAAAAAAATPTVGNVEGENGHVEAADAAISATSSAALPRAKAKSIASRVNKDKKEGEKKQKKRLLQAKKTSLATPVALNEEFAASLSRPILAFHTRTEDEDGVPQDTVEATIARKKEKKHRKKVEARRERVQQMLQETEQQLKESVLRTKGGKKRRRADDVAAKDLAFERKLKQMQKEQADKETAEKQASGNGKQKSSGDSNGNSSSSSSKKKDRKRITFSDGAAESAEDVPHAAMRYPNDKGEKKPREFYELVDVVRYGECVKAPPVFDTLPRRDAAITRLANQLESSNPKKGVASSRAERLQLLSSVGGVGEQKRLERLGLAPVGGRGTAPAAAQASREVSKEEEMRRLREGVMAAYRRNKHVQVEARKGVDMRHQFPLFS
ncbi:hypothetical protein DQ04_07091000 [Trypanosoma grayi]|uniref:hypothetical protein n=1 Tax=Trypanosoma grayi TaxID=71804 RepID=UPI0004F47D9A|nr:hypothetical protein DQ04_07091000 [Trypanosoma grayi]KEG08478.1 hypothetical protein DQ04_07091000 [Trypanosoma grayi]